MLGHVSKGRLLRDFSGDNIGTPTALTKCNDSISYKISEQIQYELLFMSHYQLSVLLIRTLCKS